MGTFAVQAWELEDPSKVQLRPDHVVWSVFDTRVGPAVASAVAMAAVASGVGRRTKPESALSEADAAF
jgi:malic enzyme